MRLGIDFGTTRIRVVHENGEVLLDEPSAIAVDRNNNRVVAFGKEAQEFAGGSPSGIAVIHPLSEGVVASFEAASSLLHEALRRTPKRFFKPEVILTIPAHTSEVERRAYYEVGQLAGIRRLHLLESPHAVACGIDLDPDAPEGVLVVDFGGGTCDLAVFSSGRIVMAETERAGGQRLDRAMVHHARQKHSLLLSGNSAELLKIHLGSAFPVHDHKTMDLQGQDLVGGVPKTVSFTGQEVREALELELSPLLDAVRRVFEHTPPELAADILDTSIRFTGGASQLNGLVKLCQEITGVPTRLSADPSLAVCRGVHRAFAKLNA